MIQWEIDAITNQILAMTDEEITVVKKALEERETKNTDDKK